VSTFRGDIKTGLESHFKNTHPNYKNNFPDELLLNNDFISGLAHWKQRGSTQISVNGVVINLSNHLFQDVAVDEKGIYLASYEIICASDATMRAQVNWFDATGTFLSAMGELYDCYGTHRVINKVMKPPSGAAVGRVYVTTHDDRNVTVKSVSFRKGNPPQLTDLYFWRRLKKGVLPPDFSNSP